MKLLAKYNRVNIPITIATLLITGVGFYFIIRYVLVHQIDKDLRIEQQEIIHYINEKKSLPVFDLRTDSLALLPGRRRRRAQEGARR